MRWRWRIAIAGVLLGAPAWLIVGHRMSASSLEDELFAATGVRPDIGFVLLGPDLNLHAFNIRFEDERLRAHIPFAKFVIPFSRLWGEGRTKSIHIRQLVAWIRTDADLRDLRPEQPGGVTKTRSEGGHPEISCAELAVYLEDDHGETEPLLISDWLVAKSKNARETYVELGSGRLGAVFIEGASARVIPVHGHLLVTDFEMRAFRGRFRGMLDLHLHLAGRYNGEVTCEDLDVQTLCRRLNIADAFRRKGLVSGSVRFHAWGPRLAQLKGAGKIRMHDASFWSPVNFRVVGVLGLPQHEYSTIEGAEFSFSIERGLLYVESGSIRSKDYEIDLRGIFDVDGACDLEASYQGTTIAIRGNLRDPKVVILPFDAVTVPFDRLYRDKLRAR